MKQISWYRSIRSDPLLSSLSSFWSPIVVFWHYSMELTRKKYAESNIKSDLYRTSTGPLS